jgi:hypothetical protein
MRVSPLTPKEDIEIAATDVWQSPVIFKNKPASVWDPNEIYWMMPRPKEGEKPPEPVIPEPEPLGLRAIEFKETPLITTVGGITTSGVAIKRSLSSDDLKTFAADPAPVKKSDIGITWVVQFGEKVTQVWAREDTPVTEICDRAAMSIGVKPQQWDIMGPVRNGSIATIYCSIPDRDGMEAAIHFGNQEWKGNVNVLYSDHRLVQEAQAQLEIEGKWRVRAAVTVDRVRMIEAEKDLETQVYPKLPEEAEVTFEFRGSVKKVTLPAGADAWTQAKAAQDAYGQTLLCSPIERTGDGYTVHVYTPKVFPVVLENGGQRTVTWVDNTSIKVIQEEARRLFGSKLVLELLPEPGLVYKVKPAASRGKSKPKEGETIQTRMKPHPTTKFTTVPAPCRGKRAERDEPVDQRSPEGRDVIATGLDRAPGVSGFEIHVIFPQRTQTIKNAKLNRQATKEEILEVVFR